MQEFTNQNEFCPFSSNRFAVVLNLVSIQDYVINMVLTFSYAHFQIVSTKLLGKQPDVKLKSVTIMHSSTTETVRLPPDGDNGQVTVHPAVRSKLPLKRKVREGKTRRKAKKPKESNNNVSSPKKTKPSPKKKKRVSPAVENEKKATAAEATVTETPPKVKKPAAAVKNKKKKKKEVIDYSGAQGETDGKKGLLPTEVVHKPLTPETDPVGKVQNWLLKSHYVLPKSKSTPVGLTDKAHHRSPQKRAVIRPKPDKKSHSVGNLPNDKEKVRLQVVYKPPFKFSVKLRKPDKTSAVSKKPDKPRNPRTGVLIRTVKEPKSAAPVVAKPSANSGPVTSPLSNDSPGNPGDNIDLNTHTVQSDLEVLLSESEFLFSDD